MARLRAQTTSSGKTYYYAVFYDPERQPKRKKLALRTRDKVVARRRLTDWERKYSLGTWDPWADNAPRVETPRRIVPDFKQALRREGLAKETRQSAVSAVLQFVDYLGVEINLHQIEERHLQAFIDEYDNQNTRANYASRLRKFFDFAVEEGYARKNPMDAITERPARRTAPRFLTRDEFRRLIEAAHTIREEMPPTHPEAWAVYPDLFRFDVQTGLRPKELSYLRWTDIDMNARMLRVSMGEHFTPKDKEMRTVPLSNSAFEILERRREGAEPGDPVFLSIFHENGHSGRIHPKTMREAFRRCREKAGLDPEYTFYSLRHTFASWMVQKGVPIADIQRLLGHDDLTTTLRYARVTTDSVRQSYDRVWNDMELP